MNNIALIAFFSVFLTHSSPIFSHLNRAFSKSRSFAAEFSMQCVLLCKLSILLCHLLCFAEPEQQEKVSLFPLPGSIGHLARKLVHQNCTSHSSVLLVQAIWIIWRNILIVSYGTQSHQSNPSLLASFQIFANNNKRPLNIQQSLPTCGSLCFHF